MTAEKACGYIREALEEMGVEVAFAGRPGSWTAAWSGRLPLSALQALLNALDSLDPMGTTYEEEW